VDTSEIKQLIATLEIEYKILEEEASLLDKQRREIGKEYIIKEAALTQIKNKLKEYEMFICHETMFDDVRIKSNNGFELLSQNECAINLTLLSSSPLFLDQYHRKFLPKFPLTLFP
jgi:hypothetical protein